MRTRRSWRNQDRLYKALTPPTTEPPATPIEYADTLYDECVKRGIPTANHESDLYIPVTEETRALLIHYGHDRRGKRATAETFINQVEGGRWFDVPFGFAPFWRKVAAKCDGNK